MSIAGSARRRLPYLACSHGHESGSRRVRLGPPPRRQFRACGACRLV